MQVTENSTAELKRAYTVTVGAADIDEKLQFHLKNLSQKIRMPGFRPGKAPVKLLKKIHGQALMGQVLEETVNESAEKLMRDNNIRPALRPNIEITKYEEDSDLEFSLEVEVLPEIEVPDFSGLKLEKLVAEADDKAVNDYLERLAAQQKSFAPAAKTYKAKEGDAVVIDFIGRIDGEAFDGGAGEDHQLELGSGSFIPGFEDQLVGVKAGDEKDVAVTFPEEYHAKEMSGKEAVFAVTVKEVKKPAEAKVDDDLAINLGLENLAALKETIGKQVAQESEAMSRTLLKRALLDQLAEHHPFDVPEGMVDIEFKQIWEQIKRDAIQSGEAKEEDFADMDGPADDKERAEFMSIAERRVRLGLLLSEVGQKNGVQIRQEEVNRLIAQEASRFPGQEKEVYDFYKENEAAAAQLRAPLYEEKVVDFILEIAEVAEKKVTRDQLMEALRALEEDDEVESKPVKKKPAAKARSTAAKKPAAKKAAPAKKAAAAKKPAAKKTAARKPAAKKS